MFLLWFLFCRLKLRAYELCLGSRFLFLGSWLRVALGIWGGEGVET